MLIYPVGDNVYHGLFTVFVPETVGSVHSFIQTNGIGLDSLSNNAYL